ncbi:flagellar protein export ATPase FliI [Carboxydothermus islandicus]|uniref:Flagellar protein export ATPase FliI n=1 Tax=Carboxydothermus islandicus TaxID=661089 RepID=A0A1L8D4R7_9THEO|nr:flagellar protein export ATPase FliI [Carboxydothermus islandicus]GAV26160.1 flagellar protein export ATPase FliI [Carboxydothermus islandicus]
MSRVNLGRLTEQLKEHEFLKPWGVVRQVIGLTVEAHGLKVSVGETVEILAGNGRVLAEVVGFKEENAILMPLGEINGVSLGSLVRPLRRPLQITVGKSLLGKVLDGLGRPLNADKIYGRLFSLDRKPPNPLKRQRIKKPFATGIKAIDGALTCGEGQRLGIFAGSGVGKSTLIGMIARYAEADVNVIALIGERGREVLDFIENDLGEGIKKSVLVVATSEQPALFRVKGAFVATAIAEYFREQGKKVLLMMDSLTRFAMAQREIGLAAGEPPSSRGYTPSVFALLPKLVERAGNDDKGSITAFYTVLVEGDDFNEPIADAVRGLLDGHIVLSRQLAGKGHYPAIDLLASNSRLMPELVDEQHLALTLKMREILDIYRQNEDLILIGAYKPGTNPLLDRAIQLVPKINQFLQQKQNEKVDFTTTKEILNTLLVEE